MAQTTKARFLDDRGRIVSAEVARPYHLDAYSLPLPRVGDITDGNAGEIIERLRTYNLVPSASEQYARASQYVSRMTPLQGEAFRAEVDRLLASEAHVRNLARRMA